MNIAIIDAEIIGKNKHRFPNLCSMKIAAMDILNTNETLMDI